MNRETVLDWLRTVDTNKKALLMSCEIKGSTSDLVVCPQCGLDFEKKVNTTECPDCGLPIVIIFLFRKLIRLELELEEVKKLWPTKKLRG